MLNVSKSRILHAAIFALLDEEAGEWGLPLLITSEPGTGKTSVVRAAAKHYAMTFKDLSPVLHGEAAFGVVPLPTKAGRLVGGVPSWVDHFAATGGRGLLFVDEITSAPPGLQGACLGLVAGKQVGDVRLPGGVRVVGACNPPELAANGHDLAPPLANRFGHLNWTAPSVEEHRAYMMGSAMRTKVEQMDPAAEEARVLAGWSEAFGRAVALTTSFLGTQANWKNKCPKPDEEQAGKAWPSDRTWDYAARAHAAARLHNLSDAETWEFIAAFIGGKATTAFRLYCENIDLPDTAAVLDGTADFKHNPKRLDRTAAFLTSATTLVAPENAAKRDARSAKLWAMLREMLTAGVGDLVTTSSQDLIRARAFRGIKDATYVIEKVQPLISATVNVGKR